MLYVTQDDFKDFKCLADKCPKSCCKQWQILIDDEALEKYEKVQGDFAEKLKSGIDFEQGVFLQKDRDCSMLDKSGLCSLQCALGEDALCYTCKTYPRHVEEFEDVREYTLSLSCPEVARMELNRQSPIGFVEVTDDEPDDFEDFDFLLYTKLVDARETIIAIAQNRNLDIFKRIDLILTLAKSMQLCLDEDRLYDMDNLIEDFGLDKKISSFDHRVQIKELWKLEILTEDWTDYLSAVKNEEDFFDLSEKESVAAEQILVSLLYTYFCGAVYDDWIYSKAALCCYSVKWILNIYKSLCCEEDIPLLEKVTYSYAREVEHSDLNLDALEEYFQDNM